MGNVGVTNMKSGDYHFSISSITCWPFTYVELVLCLIIQDFCHFLSINLLSGFRSVYGIFVLIYESGVFFFCSCLPFHFPVYQCGSVSEKE